MRRNRKQAKRRNADWLRECMDEDSQWWYSLPAHERWIGFSGHVKVFENHAGVKGMHIIKHMYCGLYEWFDYDCIVRKGRYSMKGVVK